MVCRFHQLLQRPIQVWRFLQLDIVPSNSLAKSCVLPWLRRRVAATEEIELEEVTRVAVCAAAQSFV